MNQFKKKKCFVGHVSRLNDISISTGAIIEKVAARNRKIKLRFLAAFLCCKYSKQFLTALYLNKMDNNLSFSRNISSNKMIHAI